MRRAQAILVLIALSSLPLALLGQATAPASCNGICCVRHNSGHFGAASSHEGMSCHRGTTALTCECNMKSSLQPVLVAPLPLAIPSDVLSVPAPFHARRTVPMNAQSEFSGFLPAPFEPPRA